MIEFSADKDLIVAKTNKFAFHSVDALQRVEVERIAIIDIPEANVFPEFTGQKDGSKH